MVRSPRYFVLKTNLPLTICMSGVRETTRLTPRAAQKAISLSVEARHAVPRGPFQASWVRRGSRGPGAEELRQDGAGRQSSGKVSEAAAGENVSSGMSVAKAEGGARYDRAPGKRQGARTEALRLPGPMAGGDGGEPGGAGEMVARDEGEREPQGEMEARGEREARREPKVRSEAAARGEPATRGELESRDGPEAWGEPEPGGKLESGGELVAAGEPAAESWGELSKAG